MTHEHKPESAEFRALESGFRTRREQAMALASDTAHPCPYPFKSEVIDLHLIEAEARGEAEQRRKDMGMVENQNDDDKCVDDFARLMREKMKFSREVKGRSGWQTMSAEALSEMLRDHIEKGDPVDIANFCMMLSTMGASITGSQGVEGHRRKDVEGVEAAARFVGHSEDGTQIFQSFCADLPIGSVLYTRPANVAALEARVKELEGENKVWSSAVNNALTWLENSRKVEARVELKSALRRIAAIREERNHD